jgi:hypothetical protein
MITAAIYARKSTDQSAVTRRACSRGLHDVLCAERAEHSLSTARRPARAILRMAAHLKQATASAPTHSFIVLVCCSSSGQAH